VHDVSSTTATFGTAPGRFAQVQAGDRVEVRSRFDQGWSRGFEIVEVVPPGADDGGPGYRVRRRSDGQVLPAVFSEDDVRDERRGRSMWWY